MRYRLTKRAPFCSSLKALSIDTSFSKIGVCQQKLSTLEFYFRYRLSSHYQKLSATLDSWILGPQVPGSSASFIYYIIGSIYVCMYVLIL